MNIFLELTLTAALVTTSGELLGPFVGHVAATSAQIWARAAAPGEYTIAIRAGDGEPLGYPGQAREDTGLSLKWTVTGLSPDTQYSYSVTDARGATLAEGKSYVFRTCKPEAEDQSVRLVFGSCAREDEETARTWRAVQGAQPDAVILLGDTPYIDKTGLDYQRQRYGEFAAFAPMAELLRSTPWYGTWDDHDFGRNDTDGRIAGEGFARQAFVEAHANPSYGDGERGIYTSFRRGPVEVFLLDTRTFASMEPSPFLAHSASLLGAHQWRWLMDGLVASTAPVKVLACGMIWNGAVRPGKRDHWGSYPHEREALFSFLGEKKVEGVLLVGGDIHRSRVILHNASESAGYDIHELIVSPMHAGIIESANQAHPGLLKDMGEPRTYMVLEALQRGGELQALTADYRNADGDGLYSLELRGDG